MLPRLMRWILDEAISALDTTTEAKLHSSLPKPYPKSVSRGYNRRQRGSVLFINQNAIRRPWLKQNVALLEALRALARKLTTVVAPHCNASPSEEKHTAQ